MSAAVVILNWNGRRHLERFLPGVVSRTPPHVAVVLADNASTDDSTAWVGAHCPTVRILRLDRNYGFAEGYNRALAQLDEECCILLNSDVEVTPGWCEPLLRALDEDARLGAVMPKIRSLAEPDRFEYAGASGGFIDRLGYPFCRGRILRTVERDRGQYDTPRPVFWASGAAFCCRMRAFREAGGFDEHFFAHMEEIDLSWRMQRRGWRIGVEPRSTVYHLGGGTLPTTSPRKALLNHRNNLWMLWKNLPTRELAWVFPLRLLLDGAAALGYLATGHPALVGAVWRAHIAFWRSFGRLRRERKREQAAIVARAEGIYRGSILWRYLWGRRKFGTLM